MKGKQITHRSIWTAWHLEITKLKEIFIKNGYNNSFFDNIVNRFLHKKFRKEENVNQPDIDRCVICLPFIGMNSYIYAITQGQGTSVWFLPFLSHRLL